MKKNLIVILLTLSFALVLITPSVAMASWWNPFSWHVWARVFNKKIEHQTVETNVSKDIKNQPIGNSKKEIPENDSVSANKNLTGNESNSLTTDKISNSEKQYALQVISPNGGEDYTAGQKVDVKWTSKNIPADAFIFITLKGFDEEVWISTSRNSGVESITIPSLPFTPRFEAMPKSWKYGNNFKIGISYRSNDNKIFKDYSNVFFLIKKDINKIITPEVTTTSIDTTTNYSAIINGTVQNNDPIPAKAGYHCSADPKLESNVITSSDIVLVPKSSDPIPVKINFPNILGETFYCRIAAQNSAGVGLGNILSFTPHP